MQFWIEDGIAKGLVNGEPASIEYNNSAFYGYFSLMPSRDCSIVFHKLHFEPRAIAPRHSSSKTLRIHGLEPVGGLGKPKRPWGPEQATGEPDTPRAGDIRTAWASLTPDDQQEWLLVEYDKPIKPTAILVYETYNPGAMSKISVFDPRGKEVDIWQLTHKGTTVNTSNGYPGIRRESVNGIAISTFPVKVDFRVKRVKLYLDSPRVKGWNEIDAVGLVDEKGNTHWATSAKASSSYAQKRRSEPVPLPQEVKIPEGAVTLSHVGDASTDKRSIGGSGHAVAFDRPAEAKSLVAVQIYASRYGHPDPPAEDFHVYVLDQDMKVIKDMPYPYALIGRTSKMRWYTLPLPAVEVPQKFFIALSFNPHRTKGIYLGLDKTVKKSHSYTGLPDRGYEPVTKLFDWMVRAYLVSDADAPEKEAPSGPPTSKQVINGIPVEIVQITDNSHHDRHPAVFGTNVVWRGKDGNPAETMLYNGSTIIQVSKDTRSGGRFANDRPVVGGSRIVWMGYFGNYDIILYDGTKSTKLTSSRDHERNPQISGSNVVWQCPHGADNEIFLYDGSTVKPLTDNDYEDLGPQVSGSTVVWRGKSGDDWEIFIYDGSRVRQLTDNNYDDLAPQVSGSNVVWLAHDGNDLEVFVARVGTGTSSCRPVEKKNTIRNMMPIGIPTTR